ncbi:MAG: PDZ domain-containing protein [Candidatus Riflebacteria bacterium]|nr:PDZ domain-containing protein [Candidatus Riflebacteria bacterium]
MVTFLGILKFILAFSFVMGSIALVHEFGHYITAKLSGVWVLEFGIGFGKRIFKIKLGETLYSLRPLPVGGFVRLAGMDNVKEDYEEALKEAEEKGEECEIELDPDIPMVSRDDDRSFEKVNSFAKLVILAAGSIMNFVWTAVLYSIIAMIMGAPMTNIEVKRVMPGRPAEVAGLKSGDIIMEINGQVLSDYNDGLKIIEKSYAKPLSVKVLRKHPKTMSAIGGGITMKMDAADTATYEMFTSEKLDFTLMPDGTETKATIGIELTANVYDYKEDVSVFEAMKMGTEAAVNVIARTIMALASMFSGKAPADLAGPVKVAEMINTQTQKGWEELLHLTALLSANIGLINLLPFPVLDGGRIIFVIIRFFLGIINSILGLHLVFKREWEEYVHFAGMFVLLGLIIFVTYKDIVSFF